MNKKWPWVLLVAAAVLFGVVQFGPYPFSVPRAILAIEIGHTKLVPLTADATKFVGRRGPTERELAAFLAPYGWTYQSRITPEGSHLTSGPLLFVRGDETLTADSRFRRGYWWYDLDRKP